jgi:GT2 family glycosyltransferase
MTASPEPEVSIVVPVHTDWRVLRLLDSLAHQTLPAENFEVLIVENGSHDLDRSVTRLGGNIRYLHLPAANPAAARNAGLRAARGRFLLLTDADCVAAADWIERLTKYLTDSDLAAVGGPIEKYQPASLTQQHGITVVDGQHALNYLPALHLPYVVSANAGYVTARLREIGGFDESFPSGSDVDICYRLGLAGHGVGLAPDAVVLHEDRVTLAAHFRRFRHYSVYQVGLFAKYRPESGKRFVLNPYPARRFLQAFVGIPRALAGLARGDRAAASTIIAQVTEAAGIWAGDVIGSIKYRQFYI